MAEEQTSSINLAQTLEDDAAVDEYFKQVMPKLAGAVKASNSLPAGEQFDFYTTYKEFLDVMQVEGSQALDVLGRVLRLNGIRSSGILGTSADSSEVDDKFESLIDANDQLTERISNRLDEALGIRKLPEVQLVVATTPQHKHNKQEKTTPNSIASWNIKQTESSKKMTPTGYRLLAARFVQRPQANFKEKVNNSDTPFQPKLTHKPNAKLSLRGNKAAIIADVH